MKIWTNFIFKSKFVHITDCELIFNILIFKNIITIFYSIIIEYFGVFELLFDYNRNISQNLSSPSTRASKHHERVFAGWISKTSFQRNPSKSVFPKFWTTKPILMTLNSSDFTLFTYCKIKSVSKWFRFLNFIISWLP